MTQVKSESLIEKMFYPLVRFADKISWIMLFAMMTMTAIDLFLRNFTNSSVLGANELTELMMVAVVFCSLAQCEVENEHIRLDIVMNLVSPKVRLMADFFTQGLCTVIFGLMSVSLFHHSANMKKYGEITMDLGIPLYPFVYLACFGCVLLTLVLFSKTITNLIKVVKS